MSVGVGVCADVVTVLVKALIVVQWALAVKVIGELPKVRRNFELPSWMLEHHTQMLGNGGSESVSHSTQTRLSTKPLQFLQKTN